MKDIKTGEYYRILGYVGYKNENEVSVTFHNKSGVQTSIDFERKEARKIFSPISEPPKYDPCRLFRKGDKVRVVEWNGRNYCDRDHHTELKTGCLAEIWDDERDEQQEGYVSVIYEEYIRCVPPCYLELVTPVEELEPYEVRRVDCYWSVIDKNGVEMSRYWLHLHPNAKAAAEAERDRLNAEHRKNLNND